MHVMDRKTNQEIYKYKIINEIDSIKSHIDLFSNVALRYIKHVRSSEEEPAD